MPQQPITWDTPGLPWDDPILTWDGFMPVTSGNILMVEDNRISAAMSAEDIAAVLAAIQTIRTKMPFLASISAEDRSELPKLGDKSRGFDEKCAAYMVSNPEFLPGFIDIAEFNKDRAIRQPVLEIHTHLKTLMDSVSDTLLIINSEIWMAELAYYQSAKEAKRRRRAGADVIYADLRQRFPGAGNPPENSTPTNPPTQ